MRPLRKQFAIGLTLALTLASAAVVMAAGTAAASTTPPICGPGGGSGDFDGDGFADIAIGSRGVDSDTGSVDIAYGNTSGPSETYQYNQHWNLDTPGVSGSDQQGAGLGWSVVAADFNGDGYDDLASGAPLATVGTATRAGEVMVLYGSNNRLTATGSKLFTENSFGVNQAETDNEFGHALGAGDFNADGYDDLAIGTPGKHSDAGGVRVMPGSANGLTTTGSKLWTQNTGTMASSEEAGDHFGWSLATGRFNNDKYTDLAVGDPFENGAFADEGAVHIIYSSVTGLTDAGNQLWTSDSSGVPGDSETGDKLGWSVAAGNFNGDDYCDLAAGVPDESVVTSSGTTYDGAGAVLVMYSNSAGLSPNAAVAPQYWTRNTNGVVGDPGAYADFGWSLAAGDVNGDGYWDLAIGVPFDVVAGHFHAGSVNMMYGQAYALGLSATLSPDDQLWSQNSTDGTGDVEGTAGDGYEFGYSLTMGDFNGGFGSNKDLAIAAPGDSGKGAVTVLFEWNNKLEIEPAGYDDVRMIRYDNWGTAQSGDRFGEGLS